MCRRGKQAENTHCDNCGYCMATSVFAKHQCREKTIDSNCPVCLENLRYSTKYYYALKCGHLIHLECCEAYVQSGNVNCPVCGRSFHKMGQNEKNMIEEAINLTRDQIPQELRDKKVSIICHECMHKTHEVPFHFYGLKCGGCGSYNTKMI